MQIQKLVRTTIKKKRGHALQGSCDCLSKQATASHIRHLAEGYALQIVIFFTKTSIDKEVIRVARKVYTMKKNLSNLKYFTNIS